MKSASAIVAAAAAWLLTGSTVRVQESRPAPPPLSARFHHIHLNAVDPDASIRFYTSRLRSERVSFGGADALRTTRGLFLFDKVAAPAEPNGTTSAFWHVGWGSSDIRSLYDRLVKAGTPFQTPLTDMKKYLDPKQTHYLYVLGPDKEWVEVFAETGSDDFEHVHMRSADPDAAMQWYVRHFGFSPPSLLPGKPSSVGGPLWIDLIAFRFNRLAGQSSFQSARGRVLDHFAFSVENLDQTLERLRGEGVTVVEAPREIYGGALRSAFVQGPDNLQVELVQERPGPR
jgi:catechol 2,3-dioxygenase-like lactoylglutathione lyase family enzyme